MAWYFRKSLKLGPVRLNFSKKGLGCSVGVKGLRVGQAATGKEYIHAGRNGFYYRKSLGGAKSSKSEEQVIDSKVDKGSVIHTIKAILLNDESALLNQLKKSKEQFRLDYLASLICFILSWVLWSINNITGLLFIAGSLILVSIVAYFESKRRTVIMDYDFSEAEYNSYENIVNSFNHLASCKKVWQVLQSKGISGKDVKRNAGASHLVERLDIQLGEGLPPWVESNINFPTINGKDQTIYFLPEGVLIYDSSGIGIVQYKDIDISCSLNRFIEDGNVPSDSTIVDYTWQHPNKSGGPDKRFSSNRQIPICSYGGLDITSKNGFRIMIYASNSESIELFSSGFERVISVKPRSA